MKEQKNKGRDRKIREISDSKNLKYSEVRMAKRALRPADLTYREIHMKLGSVWSIQDRDVPFEGNRLKDDYQSYVRPCVVTETPFSFDDRDFVTVAPGSSHSSLYSTKSGFKDLIADPVGEELDRKTYFRLFLQFETYQYKLLKKLTDLSSPLVERMIGMLNSSKST